MITVLARMNLPVRDRKRAMGNPFPYYTKRSAAAHVRSCKRFTLQRSRLAFQECHGLDAAVANLVRLLGSREA
jgi:hypothetical protein